MGGRADDDYQVGQYVKKHWLFFLSSFLTTRSFLHGIFDAWAFGTHCLMIKTGFKPCVWPERGHSNEKKLVFGSLVRSQ